MEGRVNSSLLPHPGGVLNRARITLTVAHWQSHERANGSRVRGAWAKNKSLASNAAKLSFTRLFRNTLFREPSMFRIKLYDTPLNIRF